MKTLLRWFCLVSMVVLSFAAVARVPYKPSDIQQALDQHDYATANREITAVLAAVPDSPMAHFWAAKVLTEEHHAGEALVEVEKAKELAPAHFKDPAKLAAFQKVLSNVQAALTKTVNDEESALAHPKTTTTIVRHMVGAAAVVPQHHLGPAILVILSVLGMALVVVIVIMIAHAHSKPTTVVVQQPASQAEEPQWPHDHVPPTSASFGAGRYGSSGAVGLSQRAPVMSSQPAAPVSTSGQGHSTGAVIGAGLGGLAAGMLLEDVLDHRNTDRDFTNIWNSSSPEIATTSTTSTGFDDSVVQQDYQSADNAFNPGTGTDDTFDSSGGSSDDFSSDTDTSSDDGFDTDSSSGGDSSLDDSF